MPPYPITVFAIAGIIATLGGVLLATVTGVSLSLGVVALVAFPAILLGGLQSFSGAIVGGLLVGILTDVVPRYVSAFEKMSLA